jgi:hypothetical protein
VFVEGHWARGTSEGFGDKAADRCCRCDGAVQVFIAVVTIGLGVVFETGDKFRH